MIENPFEELVGEQLSSVEFVQDYVQLHFDGPTLTLYVWPTVVIDASTSAFRDSQYRDRLCEQIAKKIKETVFLNGKQLDLVFEDETKISVSLDETNPENTGPEILNFIDSKKEWTVI
jgi:hypothetical protein